MHPTRIDIDNPGWYDSGMCSHDEYERCPVCLRCFIDDDECDCPVLETCADCKWWVLTEELSVTPCGEHLRLCNDCDQVHIRYCDTCARLAADCEDRED